VCKLHIFEIMCFVEFDVFDMCKCLRMYVLKVFNVLSLQVSQCFPNCYDFKRLQGCDV